MTAFVRPLTVLLSALVLVACHKAPRTVPTPARDPNAQVAIAELADPTSVAFVHLNLDATRSSGYFVGIFARMREGSQMTAEEAAFFDDLYHRTSEGYATFQKSTQPGGDPELALIVGRGHYSADDLVKLDAMQSTPRGNVAHGPYELHCDVQACATILGTHTLVMGLREPLTALLDRQLAGGGGAFTRDPTLLAILGTVGVERADIGVGCTADPSVKKILGSFLDFAPELVSAMQAGALSVDVGSGLSVRARVRTESPASAETGAGRVRAPLDSARRNPMLIAFGLRDILDAIVIGTEANDVVGSVDLPRERVERLLALLERILG